MAIINRFYEYQTDDDGRIVCFQTTGQLAGGLRTSVRAPRTAPRSRVVWSDLVC